MQIKYRRRTFGSVMQADELKEVILGLIPESKRQVDHYQAAAGNAAYLAVHMVRDSLKLTAEEKKIEEYRALQDTLRDLDPEDAGKTWQAYTSIDDEEILPLLIQAYHDAHKPLAPREQIDGKHLTDEEKAALKDPTHPLVLPAGTGS